MHNAAELISTFYGRFDIALSLVVSQQQQEHEGCIKMSCAAGYVGTVLSQNDSLLNNTHAPVMEWR